MQLPLHETGDEYVNHPGFCLKRDVSGRMTPGRISSTAGVEETVEGGDNREEEELHWIKRAQKIFQLEPLCNSLRGTIHIYYYCYLTGRWATWSKTELLTGSRSARQSWSRSCNRARCVWESVCHPFTRYLADFTQPMTKTCWDWWSLLLISLKWRLITKSDSHWSKGNNSKYFNLSWIQ